MNGHTVMRERRGTLPAFIGLRRVAASSCVELRTVRFTKTPDFSARISHFA